MMKLVRAVPKSIVDPRSGQLIAQVLQDEAGFEIRACVHKLSVHGVITHEARCTYPCMAAGNVPGFMLCYAEHARKVRFCELTRFSAH